MIDVESLSADELVATAKTLFRGEDKHWSVLAGVLGRIEDSRAWATYTDQTGQPYSSIRAFAEEELGLARSDVFVYRGLWTMMKRVSNQVPYREWRTISRSKAGVIRKALALGGDPKSWLEKAQAFSARALADEFTRLAGKEPWATFTVRVPVSMGPLIDQALKAALPEVLEEPTPDEDRIHDPSVRFRLLERILAEFVVARQGEARAQ